MVSITPPKAHLANSAITTTVAGGAGGVLAAATGAPLALALVPPLIVAAFTFGSLYAAERWATRTSRWWARVCKGDDEQRFERDLASRIIEPAVQEVIRESVEAANAAIDEAAISPIARLSRSYLKKGTPPTRFFRDALALFKECSPSDLRTLRRCLGWLLATEPDNQNFGGNVEHSRDGAGMQLKGISYVQKAELRMTTPEIESFGRLTVRGLARASTMTNGTERIVLPRSVAARLYWCISGKKAPPIPTGDDADVSFMAHLF